MAFDPDKYLAEKKGQVPVGGFDPDRYLAEKTQGASVLDGAGDATAGALRTGGRSALEMITLGASEPVFGGIHAVDKTFQQGIEALRKKIHDEGGSDFDVLQALKANYAEDVASRRKDKAENPNADLAGGIGGALVPAGPAAALVGKATGLVGKGAAKVAGLVPEISDATRLGRAANAVIGAGGKIAKGAAEGAATGLALELPRQAIEGTGGYIQAGDKTVPNLDDVAGVGALIGGGLPAAGMALKATGTVGKKASKMLMSAFLGPSEEHINYYLENPEAVNGAKSLSELKSKVDGIVDQLRESVAKGETSVSEAKAQLRDVEQAVAKHRADSKFEYEVTATQIRQQFQQAKKDLATAVERETNKLKSVKAPFEMADEVSQATKDLKDKVTKGSQDATALLDPESTIETFSPYRALKAARERLNIAGAGPATPEAKAAQSAIDNVIQLFAQLPGKLSGEEAKKLIMQLDQSERAIYNSGTYTDDVSRAYKALRSAIDEQLKTQNPKYAAAMKPVAENRALLERVSEMRDKGKAISVLGRVASPTAQVEREGLLKLGQETGRDFETPINRYLEAQAKLKDPNAMARLEQSLPEHAAAQEAERAAQMLQGPSAKAEYVEGKLQDSGLLGKQAQSEGLLENRQKGLLEAEQKLEPFKNLRPTNTQETLARAGSKIKGEERVQLVKQLNDLSKMSDTDFVKEIKNLQVKNAFQGQDIQGSRKVNLFAAVMSGLAGFAGEALTHGTGIGLAVGGTLGALADKYGPATAKKILDGVLKIQGSPTLAKIQALRIPPEAKAYLSRELADFNAATPAAKVYKISDKDTP